MAIPESTRPKAVSPAASSSRAASFADRYGDAPGNLLVTEDSIAITCLQFGNILLFPQPRPALGDDEFKLVHGMPVAPPHSYLAPYLYMQKGFKADAVIHFGTHGNLEYTPGKNVAQSQADWSDVLIGNLPHFYFYTTGNVGEGIIAKRRTHAVLVTHLTPPYVESGMRQRYSALLEDIHKVLDEGTEKHRTLGISIKKEAMRLGLHRDLNLDSISSDPYTTKELERLDAFTEEIANEKILGAYYTMNEPYSDRDLLTTTLAVAADPLAYETARKDRDKRQNHHRAVARLHLYSPPLLACRQEKTDRLTPESTQGYCICSTGASPRPTLSRTVACLPRQRTECHGACTQRRNRIPCAGR